MSAKAKVIITIEYPINLEHYQGAETPEEALLIDKDSYATGGLGVAELVEWADTIEVKWELA